RPLDRRPDLAPPQARREGSRASRLHPDRVGVRLRLRARRPAAIMSAMVLWPRSLLWRTFILLAALVVATMAAWFEIFRASEIEPRARQISQNLVSIVNITRTALVNSQPELRRELLSELAPPEGIQVSTAALGALLPPRAAPRLPRRRDPHAVARCRPDAERPRAAGRRPRSDSRRRFARPAHAALEARAWPGDERRRPAVEGGYDRRHRGDGPHHQPVP